MWDLEIRLSPRLSWGLGFPEALQKLNRCGWWYNAKSRAEARLSVRRASSLPSSMCLLSRHIHHMLERRPPFILSQNHNHLASTQYNKKPWFGRDSRIKLSCRFYSIGISSIMRRNKVRTDIVYMSELTYPD